MGQILDEVNRPETALVAYDDLLPKLPPKHPVTLQLRVQMAMAMLSEERLADADDAMRRLPDRAEAGPGIEPGLKLLKLRQATMTYHWQEAADIAQDGLQEALRPLGFQAAPGYALAALACRRSAELPGEDRQARLEQAGAWWNRASLLWPVQALAQHWPELAELADDPLLSPYASVWPEEVALP
jgi:hypothetical protein